MSVYAALLVQILYTRLALNCFCSLFLSLTVFPLTIISILTFLKIKRTLCLHNSFHPSGNRIKTFAFSYSTVGCLVFFLCVQNIPSEATHKKYCPSCYLMIFSFFCFFYLGRRWYHFYWFGCLHQRWKCFYVGSFVVTRFENCRLFI